MKKILCILCVSINIYAGEWIMFSDGKDTYIYSSKTGEIYIRHHLGKKNYEDMFVKMPRGMQANELKDSQNRTRTSSTQETQQIKDMRLDTLKKTQEMLNAAIE